MKTLLDLSKSLGVEKQSIYRYVKRAKLYHIDDCGTWRVDEEQEKKVTDHFSKHIKSESEARQNDSFDMVVELLNQQLKTKDEQLKAKDTQINDLMRSLQAEQTKTGQLLLEHQETQNKGIIARLFRR